MTNNKLKCWSVDGTQSWRIAFWNKACVKNTFSFFKMPWRSKHLIIVILESLLFFSLSYNDSNSVLQIKCNRGRRWRVEGSGGEQVHCVCLKKNKCSPSLVCVSLPFTYCPPLHPPSRTHSLHLKCMSPRRPRCPPWRIYCVCFLPVNAPHEKEKETLDTTPSAQETPPPRFSFWLRGISVCNTDQLRGKRCSALHWHISFPSLLVLFSPA